jgi:hypothetical protein
MKRGWIILTIVFVVLASPFVSLRISTVRRVARIESLQGRTGEFTNIVRGIDTRYRPITDTNELERARDRLGLATAPNLSFVRFTGEGIPYFYGWVAYDPVKREIIRAKVDQLW